MASKLLGRAACPECGFASAHVKQSEKCVYRYCPDCNAQYYAKSEAAQARLLASMRPEGAPVPPVVAPEPEPVKAPAAAPAPAPEPVKRPAPRRSGLFGLSLEGGAA